MSNYLYMLVGIPASGKSTLANKLKLGGCNVVSSDEVRKELGCLTDMSRNSEVFIIVKRRVAEGLKTGNTVLDATNTSISGRKEYIEIAKSLGCNTIALFMDKPLSQCKLNNKFRDNEIPETVIESMHDKLQPPTIAEGFEQVITYSKQ